MTEESKPASKQTEEWKKRKKQILKFILLFTNRALIFREWSLKIHHDKRNRKPLVTEEQDTSRESQERVMLLTVQDDEKHNVLVGFRSDSSVGPAMPQVDLEKSAYWF